LVAGKEGDIQCTEFVLKDGKCIVRIFFKLLSLACHYSRVHPSSNRSFDLVFIEMSRYQCYYGLVHHVGSPPVIGIRTVGITAATLAAVGNPNNPAYFPDYYLPYTSYMTFFERVHNTAFYMWNRYVHSNVAGPLVSRALLQCFF
jgi:hypothetical protein